MQSAIVWKNAKAEIPDDEITVLIAFGDGEVWTGFRLAGQWRYVSADLAEAPVVWWADFPAPPSPNRRRRQHLTPLTSPLSPQ